MTTALAPQYHRKQIIPAGRHILSGVPPDAPSGAKELPGLLPAPTYVAETETSAVTAPRELTVLPLLENTESAVIEPESLSVDSPTDSPPEVDDRALPDFPILAPVVSPILAGPEVISVDNGEAPTPPDTEATLPDPSAATRAKTQAPPPPGHTASVKAQKPAPPIASVVPSIFDKLGSPQGAPVLPSAPRLPSAPTLPAAPRLPAAPTAPPAEPTIVYVREPVGPTPPARVEAPLQVLPDVELAPVKPSTTVATQTTVKEPMFVWHGKPHGAGPTTAAKDITVKKELPPIRRGDPVDPQIWFDQVMQHALDAGASDLHLTLDGEVDELTARLRIDGQMQLFDTIYGNDARIIMGKFKAAAELSSGGSFIPEESLYSVDVDGETRKARVALFRTNNGGDALVLRLPPTGPLRSLEDLEFAPDNLALFHRLLRAANRMVLIAGPMGSGKTTTAHAALKQVSTSERTIWSVEDPVERDLEGITQLEIDDANGAGFEALLPTLIRSDYDTLFLGEIRDKSTAAAAVRQAKAGRQVITTIHANNNVTALLRLIELAQDSPLSVMDAVLGVVSQRLVRRLNPDWDQVDPATKYRGRVPIHEVLLINDELTEAIMRDRPIREVKEIAIAASKSTFERDAQRLIDAGITDLPEVRRVLGD